MIWWRVEQDTFQRETLLARLPLIKKREIVWHVPRMVCICFSNPEEFRRHLITVHKTWWDYCRSEIKKQFKQIDERRWWLFLQMVKLGRIFLELPVNKFRWLFENSKTTNKLIPRSLGRKMKMIFPPKPSIFHFSSIF